MRTHSPFSALLAYSSPCAHSLKAGALLAWPMTVSLSLAQAPARLICQTLGSWRACHRGPVPGAQPRGSSTRMCAPSGVGSVRPRPRWDKVEAVGALLPQARAALPRSPVLSGLARPPRPAQVPGALRAGPASTPSIKLQPCTGALLPQKPEDSPASPLGTRVPSGGPGPGGDTSAKRPTGGAPGLMLGPPEHRSASVLCPCPPLHAAPSPPVRPWGSVRSQLGTLFPVPGRGPYENRTAPPSAAPLAQTRSLCSGLLPPRQSARPPPGVQLGLVVGLLHMPIGFRGYKRKPQSVQDNQIRETPLARATWRALLIHVPALPAGTSEPLRSRPSTRWPWFVSPWQVTQLLHQEPQRGDGRKGGGSSGRGAAGAGGGGRGGGSRRGPGGHSEGQEQKAKAGAAARGGDRAHARWLSPAPGHSEALIP
ncbi:unnamed protein product [Rangifer tarandus platyrhynchus]|uniref:Uncharacterized protein n=1 Tax=Rangifer tarandus platyrhynchus TaxID=3082113 RepID=A0AC59ZBA3_RANTA